MFRLVVVLFFYAFSGHAAIDIGIGTSSFTGGRPAPALALGLQSDSWGILFRSVGVQTSIYAQNAWTIAASKKVFSENYGMLGNSIGVGFGGSYILRAYRTSLTSEVESTKEYVLGPHLSAKFQIGFMYLGFDTVLGITKQIIQHLALNFQDMSHVTIGFTF